MAAAVTKETMMELKVNLECPACYKKVRKILCSIREIRDQEYDEKKNVVKIKVVCCSPEKIRDKIRSKGGKCIQDIAILPPKKPNPPKPAPPKPDPPTICCCYPACGCVCQYQKGCGCGALPPPPPPLGWWGCVYYYPQYPPPGFCISDDNPNACLIM